MTGTGNPDPNRAKRLVNNAIEILSVLGLPPAQLNERSALALLAFLNLRPESSWSEAQDPMLGITPIMDFARDWYGKPYAPNTRESFRRQTVHQFEDSGLVIKNPDDPARPTNSPKTVYQIGPSTLKLLRTFGTADWESSLNSFLASAPTLRERYAAEREMQRIPVVLASGARVTLSPGGQNVLIEKIIDEFCSRFTPNGKVLYIGDSGGKFVVFEREELAALGVHVEEHGKMPDVVVYYQAAQWLILIEAVTSHGPVDAKRHNELRNLFSGSLIGLVYVTAFYSRRAMVEYLGVISWETEVWVAEAPTHLIHFNGERFLGPYNPVP